MLVRIAQAAAALAVVAVTLWLAFVMSFRTKFRPVQDAIRRMNRRVLNPRQMHTAGRPGARASVVHHVGRTSGTSYRTPVVAVPTSDGFVFALPYGPVADWVRNTLAAGSADIEHEGQITRVDQPELVAAADVDPLFPRGTQRMNRIFGVDDFLVVRRV